MDGATATEENVMEETVRSLYEGLNIELLQKLRRETEKLSRITGETLSPST